MITGILLGLGSAFLLSVSYLCSRWFSGRWPQGAVRLLVLAQIELGVLAAALFFAVRPPQLAPVEGFAGLVLGTSVFYLVGQACLFRALRQADASRLSPLLGLKILALAAFSAVFLSRHYTPVQWAAVGLSVAAAAVLARAGTVLRRRVLAWLLATVLFYSLTDLCIKALVDHFDALSLARASALSASLSYMVSGVLVLPLLLLIDRPRPRAWLEALPFALAWFGGILLVFACFAQIGVVFGGIVQSTRGVLSIGLGWLVAALGHEHLEQRAPARVVARRVLAAALMVAAIALFSLGGVPG